MAVGRCTPSGPAADKSMDGTFANVPGNATGTQESTPSIPALPLEQPWPGRARS